MEGKPATLSQIARSANVSITTVSRILAGKRLTNFSEETIQRVRQTANDLQYRPNLLVQGIQKGRTGLIGVVMPAYGGFYSFCLGGIHDSLIQNDFVPIVLWSQKDSLHKTGKSELEQIHALVDRRVDGIILKPIFDAASNQYLHEIFSRQIPLVVLDRELSKTNTNFVGTDNEVGIRTVIEHLCELGHRNITYYGPDSPVSSGIERLNGFRTAAKAHKLKSAEVLTEGWSATPENAAMAFNTPNKPTAVVCVNDDYAILVQKAAQQAGLRIPEQLSITGFGNLHTYRYANPPLTTLDQHPHQIGQSAAELLLSQIESHSKRQPQRILIPPELIQRGSTAKAPQGADAKKRG